MEINVTLLIQGVHFIIAWVVLKNILLRPTLRLIDTQDNRKESLLVSLDSQEAIIQKQLGVRNECIKQYQCYFMRHAPDISKKTTLFFFTSTVKVPQLIEVKDEVVDKHTDKLRNKITEQLQRVRI